MRAELNWKAETPIRHRRLDLKS